MVKELQRSDMNFERKGSRMPAGAVILAVLFTLATFILLPSLETMRERVDDTLEIRTVDTLTLAPPPPPLPKPPPPRKEEEQRQAPKPEMETQKKRVPLHTMLNFNFEPGSPEGDFALDFEIAGPQQGDIGDQVFSLGDIDKNPVPLLRTQPLYPIQAKLRKIEGMVLLRFVVAEDGRVEDIDVIESTPGDTFVNAARRAVEKWKFKPGMKDGQAVPVRVQQKLTFKLE